MRLLYDISLFFYKSGLFIASFFNKKAWFFVRGRRNVFRNLKQEMFHNKRIIWIHCSSLGEFEQARPLIEIIEGFGEYSILLTFFSPSGYEIRKNFEKAKWVYYLPLDSKSNAKHFVDIVKPEKVFFVKYDIWYHYLEELKSQNIDTFLFSANFRPDQVFFRWYGGFFRKMLHCFTHIFVQDEESQKLLLDAGIENVTVNGDTRFDRVLAASKAQEEFEEIEKFKGNSLLFVIGSAWLEDMEVLIPVLNNNQNNLKVIVAPHEINPDEIGYYKSELSGKVQNYTHWNKHNFDFNCLILDTVGMLSSVYRYADFAYVGGGFGKSIHNVLEPAVFGVPVIIGPNYSKFLEARELVKRGGAIVIDNSDNFESMLRLMIHNDGAREKKAQICKNYVDLHGGATQAIINTIFQVPVEENVDEEEG